MACRNIKQFWLFFFFMAYNKLTRKMYDKKMYGSRVENVTGDKRGRIGQK